MHDVVKTSASRAIHSKNARKTAKVNTQKQIQSASGGTRPTRTPQRATKAVDSHLEARNCLKSCHDRLVRLDILFDGFATRPFPSYCMSLIETINNSVLQPCLFGEVLEKVSPAEAEHVIVIC